MKLRPYVDPDIVREDAEAAYEHSGDLVNDAFDWLAGSGQFPAELVDAVVAWYKRQARYTTAVDDLIEADEP